ncbi:MAG: GNAT family N-acetyltransferase [Pseudomonadota bacterium]
MSLTIRPYTPGDTEALWAMLEPVFRAGETYCIERDITREAALAYWSAPGNQVFLAERGGDALGSYLLCANKRGGGDHVANCAYVTATEAQGQGVARTMLAHSLQTARDAGFTAMQFNAVIATNTRAIATWQRAGFEIVGRLPGAFRHPREGLVDALVLYRHL